MAIGWSGLIASAVAGLLFMAYASSGFVDFTYTNTQISLIIIVSSFILNIMLVRWTSATGILAKIAQIVSVAMTLIIISPILAFYI
jgi:hypothetical protein